MAAGDFSAGTLPQFKTRLESYWQDALAVQRFQPQTGFIQAILDTETAQISKLFSGNAKNQLCEGVKFVYMKPQDRTANLHVVNNIVYDLCDFDGVEGEADSVILKIDREIEQSFSVLDDGCANLITQANKIAEGYFATRKAILEKINEYAHGVINTGIGADLYTDNDGVNLGAISSLVRNINPGNFNYYDFPSFASMFQLVNRYSDLLWLDGTMMFKEMASAFFQRGTNAGDVGKYNALREMMPNYRPLQLDFKQVGVTNTMYSIARGALAVAFHNNNSTTPVMQNVNNGVIRMKYAEPLGLVHQGSPVMMDVTYKQEEVPVAGDTRNCMIKHTWNLRVFMRIWQTPQRADGRTGINKFVPNAGTTKLTNPNFPTFSA